MAAFDRLSPQGSLRWGFDDAMRRIAQPETDVAAPAWAGPAPRPVGAGTISPHRPSVRRRRRRGDGRTVGHRCPCGGRGRFGRRQRGHLGCPPLSGRPRRCTGGGNRPVSARSGRMALDPPDLGAVATMVGSLVGSPDPDRALVVGESGDDAAPTMATPIGLAGRERRASGRIGLGRVRGRQRQGRRSQGRRSQGRRRGRRDNRDGRGARSSADRSSGRPGRYRSCRLRGPAGAGRQGGAPR